MKIKRKIIEIDDELCDGCGQCVPSCAEGALQIIDGKARIVKDNLCDGLGACMGECPNGALNIIEREAEEFDEEAVATHLADQADDAPPHQEMLACGCPSHQIQTFAPPLAGGADSVKADAATPSQSALSHWPVQIRLVPADAPFLKNADLLVLADCAAVAYPSLHPRLLAGKTVMMGCPKFDDANAYIEKFKAIFTTAGIKSLSVVFMEVPCCLGLSWIVKKAVEKAGIDIPVKEITIGVKGQIIAEKEKSTHPAEPLEHNPRGA